MAALPVDCQVVDYLVYTVGMDSVEACGTGPRIPLPALLAEAQTIFARDFDARLATSEFPALSLAHSRNVLRYLGDGPRRASAIAAEGGVSKQALSQQIAHLEHNGFLRVDPDPADARARLLCLTEKGERAQRLVRRLFVEIEDDWAATFGGTEVEVLRRVLTAALGRRRPRC